MFHNAEINFWNFPMVTRYTGPMVTRYTGGLSQLPVVQMSWGKKSKKKPSVLTNFCKRKFIVNIHLHYADLMSTLRHSEFLSCCSLFNI